jgi:type VI secretion system protein ImpH
MRRSQRLLADSVSRALLRADTRSPLAGLLRDPYPFEFFQAVRLTALAAVEHGVGRDDSIPSADVRSPHVRFRAHIGLAFPGSSIASYSAAPVTPGHPDDSLLPEMTVTFLALGGTSGVLPWHYTQLLIDRVREKDFGFRDFLDLFNHRAIEQFYRAWEKCHFYVGYELSARSGAQQPDRFTQALFSVIGMGTAGLRGRQVVPDEGLLFYSGHFSHRPRSATRVWGIEHKFRVRVEVARHSQFQELMPDGPTYRALEQVVRFFVGPSFDFDLQIVLKRDEVPRCQLTTRGSVRLGWNSWLFSKPPSVDVDDAVFRCDGNPSR